jgi:hypothetical protein
MENFFRIFVKYLFKKYALIVLHLYGLDISNALLLQTMKGKVEALTYTSLHKVSIKKEIFCIFTCMEQYLPFLIAIGLFAYKTYANFQKEQDKARKRMESQKNAPKPPAPRPSTKANPTPASPSDWSDWPWNTPTSPVPTYTPPAHVPAAQSQHMTAYEAYTGAMEADEVTRIRKAKQQQQRLKASSLLTRIEEKPEENSLNFDLREAIIQSAILERPYR